MRRTVAMLVVLVTCGSSQAADPKVDRVEIVQHGIYELQFDRHLSSHEGRAFDRVRAKALMQITDVVPGWPCISYGVEYRIIGEPAGAAVEIEMVTRIPGSSRQRTRTTINRTVGGIHFRSFTFDRRDELLPGTWTFEFKAGGQVIGEHRFHVLEMPDDIVIPCETPATN